jgi:hypothetical protein
MKRLYSNVGSMQSALEKRPEILKAVRVYAALHVLDRMVNHVVRLEAGKFIVGDGIIGIELRSELDLIQNFDLQGLTLHVRHNLRPNAAKIAVKDSHNGSAAHVLHTVCVYGLASHAVEMLTAALVSIAHLPADECLIDFDLPLSVRSKLRAEGIVLHRQPDAVKHEPCRLLSDLHVSRNLVAADSVLAVGDQPSCGEPFVQRNRGIFHHSSNLDGELTLRMMSAALPEAAIRIELNALRTAGRTGDLAIGPASDREIVDAVVGIREVDDWLLKALWFGHGRFLHDEKVSN